MFRRRDFLKSAGGLTALSMGLNFFSPAMFKRRILAGETGGKKKMVFIFQRGGNDGINAVIPRGDSEYNTTNRPTLYIPEAQVTQNGTDLGNGFAQLHPMMGPMMENFNNGNLAVIHRVGYRRQSQSHFDSQQYWENGVPGNPSLEQGMIFRHIKETMDQNDRFVAASMSSGQLVALKGDLPIPSISNVNSYNFSGSNAKVQKFLGQLPGAPLGTNGKGLLGLYGGPHDSATKPYRSLVYNTGLSLADSINIVQDALAQGPYTPTPGAVYPGGRFGEKLQQIAMLLKRTDVQILGVNIGGWDTHTNQGATYGHHGNILQDVAQGFQALSRDLQDQWGDLLLCTMSEFGRTSKENGSRGTDHAYAGAMFIAGGAVKGGVYNCDSSTWANGDIFSTSNGRYLSRRTDFRAVFAEIFQEHFGDSDEVLAKVIPNLATETANDPARFQRLNFL